MKVFKKWVAIILTALLILQGITFTNFFSWDVPKAYAEEQSIDLKVNFQPQTEAIPNGYLPDYGQTYGEKNGYSYGWDITHEDKVNARKVNEDPVLDTNCQISLGGKWEIAVANGSYDVTAGVGDALENSLNTINVEGINYWNSVSLEANKFLQQTKTVEISDGKLTVDQGNAEDGKTRINYIQIKTSQSQPQPQPQQISIPTLKVQVLNDNKSDSINTIYSKYKLLNTGSTSIKLSDVKLRYYYTIDGEKAQNFWCDWSSAGSNNITGTLTKLTTPMEGADYYQELGFTEGAGNLEPGKDIEIQTRIAKSDWSNYNQANDYSFNSIDAGYTDWSKVTAYCSGQLLWGVEPQTPSQPVAEISALKLQVLNDNKADSINTIYSNYKVLNTGTTSFKLSDVKIRYYYTIDGDKAQTFWCDWCSAGTNNVNGMLVKMAKPMEGADYYLEIGFKNGAGSLEPGKSVELKTRIAKSDWSNYKQTNDFSYNKTDYNYVDWNKAAVFLKEGLLWGSEPQIEVKDTIPPTTPTNIAIDTINTNKISFKWDNSSDNTGVAGYFIYRDDKQIAKITDVAYFEDTGLSEATVYKYQVAAYDAANNISAKSDVLSVTTTSIITAQSGLKGEYFNHVDLTGLKYTRVDDTIDFDWKNNTPAPGITNKSFSVRWTGQIQPLYSETYTFYSDVKDGVKLWVNNVLIINAWDKNGRTKSSGTIKLNAGQKYDIKMEFCNKNGASFVSLSWSSKSQAKSIISKSALAPVAIPSIIDITATTKVISLSWESVSFATGYDVEVDGMVLDNGMNTSYTHSNLVPGTSHTYRVRARSSLVVGGWSALAPKVTLFDAPSNLTASATNSTVTVAWDAKAGATGYDIEVDGKIIDNGLNIGYLHSSLLPGTEHSYKVRAKSAAVTGEWSDILKSWTLPGIPPNVITSNPRENSIQISWDSVSGTTGYDIEIDGQITSDVTSPYINTGLLPGTLHKYRIRAKNSSGAGSWSDEVTKWTLPDVISNINTGANETSITLSWGEVSGATSYDMEIDGKLFENATFPYIHSDLASGTKHAYRIRAKNDSGIGRWSEFTTVWTLPDVPEHVTVSVTTSTMKLTWDTVEGATGYEVEVDNEPIEAATNSLLVKDLLPGTQHSYKIRAKNSSGAGKWSVQLTKWTLPGNAITIRSEATDTRVILAWDTTPGTTGFDIKVDGTVIEDVTSPYQCNELLPGTEHKYSIRAKNASGLGEWCEELAKWTLPAIPTGITTDANENDITVKWNSVLGSTGYDIKIDGNIIENASSPYIDSGLQAGTLRTYSVRAKNSSGTGDWSQEVTKWTLPGTIANINFDSKETSIKVFWNSVIGATGYDIELDGEVVEISNNLYENTGLVPGTMHQYRVRAKNSSGIGKWSAFAMSTTKIAIPELSASEILNTSIQLVWSGIDGAKSYEIEVDGVVIKDITGTTYLHKGLIPGTAHTYKVRAIGSAVEGEWSSLASQATPLGIPVNITSEATQTNIDLSWDGVIGASGYEIEIDGTRVDNTSSTNYMDNNLVPGTRHTYRIRALSSVVTGEWSTVASEDTLLDTPINVNAISTETTVDISWSAVEGATSYEIELDGTEIVNTKDIHYLHTGLTPGTTHAYRVRAATSVAKSGWGESVSRSTLLGVPENTLANPSETSIVLTWDDVSGAKGYELLVDETELINAGEATFTHRDLASSSRHTYKIRAISGEITSPWSNDIEMTTLPLVPKNIKVTSTSTSITLVWDEVSGATGYDVEVYGSPVDNGIRTTYTQNDLTPNMQRTYKVRAKNAGGVGNWSTIIAKTTLPGVPSNITSKAEVTSITVKWDDVAGATGYDIELDDNQVVEAANATYLHSGLLTNSDHTYRVRSKNDDGTSDWSQPATSTTLPAIPANIVVTAKSQEITITWDDVAGATGYDIEADGLVMGNGTDTSFVHKNLKPNSEHIYRVRAKNGEVKSTWSEEVSQMTYPAIPGNLTAKATSTEITLHWDTVEGAIGYDIEVDGDVFDNETNVTYIHKELIPNKEHTYRVRARNAGGAGEWSEALIKATLPATPDHVTAKVTSNSITISWDKVEGIDNYDLLVDGKLISEVEENSYTHKDLKPNSTHVYRIRAKSGEITGEWSETLVAATLVGIPANIEVKASSNQIQIAWDEVDGAGGYDIEVDGTIVEDITETTYIHKDLEPNTKHEYRIRAKNDNGNGEWSKLLAQTTTPDVPKNLEAEATATEIALTWDAVEGATTYDLEVDGEIVKEILDTVYLHAALDPNTSHSYRIRSASESGASEWSDLLEKNTAPELSIDVGQDNVFNFVIVIPEKKDVTTRTIIVTYNPDELEVVDLFANTPRIDTEVGSIEGTNVKVTQLAPGKIVYEISNADKTIISSIKFMSLTSGDSKVTCIVK